jgi:carbonic anhydrase
MKAPHTILRTVLLAAFAAITSCQPAPSQKNNSPIPAATAPQIHLTQRILSREEQARLTPDEVLAQLQAGNARFMQNSTTQRLHDALVRESSGGQWPKAIVLSCADLRLPPEDIFDQGLGDLEVLRISGNRPNDALIASMALTCGKEGTKVIVILGHDRSQAIRAAIDQLNDTTRDVLTDSLKHAVRAAADYPGQHSAVNTGFVRCVAKKNVEQAVALVTARNAYLRERVQKGELRVVGAYYDMQSGQVTFL